MRPRFRFIYALAAGVATYALLAAFQVPRPYGYGHHAFGRHGWHARHYAGGCGATCAPTQAEPAAPQTNP